MDLEILSKRINTFRTKTGRLTKLSDELLYEILTAWEQWTGPLKGFYSTIGVTHRKLASVLGKAKKLKREGYFPESSFKEVALEQPLDLNNHSSGQNIEVVWNTGHIIRFPGVDPLIDFLKKVA